MINDLVLSPTITPKLHVCKVVDVCGYRECVGLYDIADEDQYMIGKYANHLEPIPLTEKILKANGFEEFGEMLGGIIQWRFYFEDGKIKMEHVKCMPKWDFFVGINAILDIWYVHQLQHALRLCGLNELADNFKIE